MKINNAAVSLFFVAVLAATSSEANNGVGQGTMYGTVQTNFDGSDQRLYANPTKEPLGEDPGSMRREMSAVQSPLPPGWSEHFDQSSGQYYYYSSLDGTTTWDRPAPVDEETSLKSTLEESVERGDMQASDLASVPERSIINPQELEKVEDPPFGRQQSWDSRESGMSVGQFTEQNSVQGRPTNRESQLGDSFSSRAQVTENANGQRWTQQDIATEQGETRESLQLSNGPKDSSASALAPQSIQRNPGMIPNASNGSNDSAESQESDDRRGNTFQNSDRVVGRTPPEQPHVGGWGLPTQGTEPSSPAFVNRENSDDIIQQYSRVGNVSGPPPESRHMSSLGKFTTSAENPLHDRPNSGHQNPSQPRDHPNQASSGERERRQELVGGNNPSNRQSPTQPRQSSPGNVDPRFRAPPRSHPSNTAYDSRSEGPRPPRPQYPNSQYPQQRNSAMAPSGQYQHSEYQQPQGNPRPSQYTDYTAHQQAYRQQPRVSNAVTGVLEDGTTAVKDVLGKSWQGLVGFSSRTREAMGQARDQVVTGASVAGQSISEKSTNWWGQAKSAFGSVFEKGDDTNQPQYSMSNQYGGQPPQRYPPRQNNQSYHGQNPAAHGPQGGGVQMPSSRLHERQTPSNQRNFQGQQYQPQNGQIRGPKPQPRYDPPLPQQGQARPPPQPYQNQYQHPPRRPNHTEQQGHQADRRPQQLSQGQHPDPWSHPGLSGDV